MVFFWKDKKENEVVDLTENQGAGDSGSKEYIDLQNKSKEETTEEKKRRFVKRISDMADKLEEISNQIYLIQQRVEVLERKLNVTRDSNI